MELKSKMELEILEFQLKTMQMDLEFYYLYWNTLQLTNHSQKLKERVSLSFMWLTPHATGVSDFWGMGLWCGPKGHV